MKFYYVCKNLGAFPSASVCAALLAGTLIFTGCGKAKKSTADAPSPEAVKQAATDHMPAYAPLPAKAPAAVAAPNGAPDLAEMDRAMLRWLMSNRRVPSSFEDFAATAGMPIPPAPTGKKYVIAKDMHIHLVSK